MFKGSYVALITPFKNGEIDEKKLQDLVEWHISEKIDGLVAVGTTGESATLTHAEHIRVVDIVVKAARKRIPVIAGAGSNSTAEAISLTKESREIWADAVLLVSPYYNKPTQEGLKAHFSAVAQSTSLPIILYNIPSRSVVNIQPSTVEDLAKKHKNIVAIKDATGGVEQATEILLRLGSNFSVLSGDDSLTLPLLSIGAQGIISVAANIVPKEVGDLVRLYLEGKSDQAKKLHHRLYPLVKALFLETNPTPVKTAMAELGLIDSDEMRLPLVPVRFETREKIKLALKAFGVQVPTNLRS